MNGTEPLADLRAYHLPDAVSWWPPAPGWWILALLLIGLVGALAAWLLRRHRRQAAARAARAELLAFRGAWDGDGDTLVYVRGLSRLLRRFALVRFGPRRVAGLVGEDWLAFLDANGGAGRFQSATGRLLLDAVYRPVTDLPVTELAGLVADWIECNREVR